jgi:hypothetical protein
MAICQTNGSSINASRGRYANAGKLQCLGPELYWYGTRPPLQTRTSPLYQRTEEMDSTRGYDRPIQSQEALYAKANVNKLKTDGHKGGPLPWYGTVTVGR